MTLENGKKPKKPSWLFQTALNNLSHMGISISVDWISRNAHESDHERIDHVFRQPRTSIGRPVAVRSSTTALRCMIVDDSPTSRKILRRMLESVPALKDSVIDEAEDGSDALALFENGSAFDCIFMDAMMKSMHGPETVRKLRAQKKFKGVIIGLTGNTSNTFQLCGLDLSLFKPLTEDVLIETLQRFGFVAPSNPTSPNLVSETTCSPLPGYHSEQKKVFGIHDVLENSDVLDREKISRTFDTRSFDSGTFDEQSFDCADLSKQRSTTHSFKIDQIDIVQRKVRNHVFQCFTNFSPESALFVLQ